MGTGRSVPSPTHLAMRTKRIVLYCCCDLGSLAEAPGDSRPRTPCTRQPRERATGTQTSPKRWRPARLPPLTHSPAASPGLPAAPIGSGIATDATSVVAPTPTAHSHHVHAHATPTTTSAARSVRHPQTEGTNPGTRMQRQAITGYQHCLEASEKPRRRRRSAQACPPAEQTPAHAS